MTDSTSIWIENVQVKTYEIDERQHWKPACFFQAMQQAATNHAASLGFGYLEMLARDQIWIISRAKLVIHLYPEMGETVVVETWPKGVQQKLFFGRDFTFSSPDGRCYATATTAWILINPTLRRILSPRLLQGQVPDNGGRSALDEPLERIAMPAAMDLRGTAVAGYSAVDLMRHVNNARYTEWACDTFPLAQYAENEIAWLQLNYLNEVKPGETVQVFAGQDPGEGGRWVLRGENLATQATAFEAALGWRKRT